MDLPNEILIHNEILGLKGGKGTLVATSPPISCRPRSAKRR